MIDIVTRLWSPSSDLQLTCPAPPAGVTGTNSIGHYDPATLASAYLAASVATIAAVTLVVFICYLWNQTSVGPSFVRRWYLSALVATVFAALLPVALLAAWPTHALANSCETNPNPFAAPLPLSELLTVGVSGALWGVVGFVLLSIILTRTVGRVPQAGGFFHNRGCPWPRFY